MGEIIDAKDIFLARLTTQRMNDILKKAAKEQEKEKENEPKRRTGKGDSGSGRNP